jgi:hypothetical protein
MNTTLTYNSENKIKTTRMNEILYITTEAADFKEMQRRLENIIRLRDTIITDCV